MTKGLFAKKSIQDLRKEASSKKGLERTLTGWNLTLLGIGAIIGAGIFVLTGQGAAVYAGPGVVLSFVFAALICVFAAFCYAEFASLIPISGGPYSYAYATLGEFAAWTIGWILTLEYLFLAATVAVGWTGYFSSLLGDFGLHLPAAFAQSPFAYDAAEGWTKTGAVINLPAVCVMGFIGGMIAVGIKAAARLNSIMVAIKMTLILLFLVCGVFYIQSSNWVPFIPKNTGVFGEYGFSGILRGAGVVFFAYIGFDALSTLAQESRDPQKDMPFGMIGSLSVSAIAYVLVALVLTGVVSYKLLNTPAPFSVAVNAIGPKFIWLRYVVNFGILAAIPSVILVMLLGQTRIIYTIAQDGLLPKAFGTVHKKLHTPFFTTVCVTLFGMALCGFFPVGILGQLVSMGTLLAFLIVCFGVLILRYKQPTIHRPFKVPLFPWIPIAGVLACLTQMLFLPRVIWVQLVTWMFIGYIVYFTYGVRKSHLRAKRKRARK